MPLTVETGSGVANANSYISLIAARALLLPYGMVLDIDDTIAETQLVKGAFYLESYDDKILGYRTIRTQPLLWPRAEAAEGSFTLAGDTTPVCLLLAQCFAAVAIGASELVPSTVNTERGKVVTSTGLGPLSKGYTVTGDPHSDVSPKLIGTVELTLKPILKFNTGSGLKNHHA